MNFLFLTARYYSLDLGCNYHFLSQGYIAVKIINLRSFFFLISLSLFFICNIFSQGKYFCSYTDEPIIVDGTLSESTWRNARPLPFFVPPDFRVPESRTIAKMLWDDQFIYVAFKAEDMDLKSTFTQRDSKTFLEDVLEIFLQPHPPEKFYYNFEINALGTVFDAANGKIKPGDLRQKWNCDDLQTGIRTRGTMNQSDDKDASWVMEVAIPFDSLPSLEQNVPEHKEKWRFHLSRYDYSGYLTDGKELSSCAHLTKVNYHYMPDWMGLIFVKNEDSREDVSDIISNP